MADFSLLILWHNLDSTKFNNTWPSSQHVKIGGKFARGKFAHNQKQYLQGKPWAMPQQCSGWVKVSACGQFSLRSNSNCGQFARGQKKSLTWKTVSNAAVIELKLEVGVPSGKLKKPPKSCIPSRAKINMNRKSRNNSDKIEAMAFIRAITRFLNEAQYLKW